MRRVAVPLGLIVALAGPATAGGLTIIGGSARAIGRAGTGTVGDDGGGALLVNPAAIARRGGARVQLGVALVDDATTWEPDHRDGPVAIDQAGSRVLPLAAAVVEVRGWVLGAGVMSTGVVERALRDPRGVPDPDDLGAAFEYRYAGIAGRMRRDVVTVGAARRIADAAAVGVAIGASRITLDERRRVWAGFAGITPVGDPRRDVDVGIAGRDGFVPHATVGLLLAPPASPLELGASVSWTARADLDGAVEASGVNGGAGVRVNGPSATMSLRPPLAVRAGARYLGDRFVVELGGDVWVAADSARAPVWAIDGVTVVDPSTVTTALTRMPSRVSLRTHGAIRGAVDVELIAGFLWGTAGYAFTVGGTTEDRLSPTLGELGGHTIALGVEGTAGGFTYTVGWSRTVASRRRGGDALRVDNPFGAGDGPVPGGRFDGSSDQLGVLIDLELGGP